MFLGNSLLLIAGLFMIANMLRTSGSFLLNGCVFFHWSIAHFYFCGQQHCAVPFQSLYLCVSHFCFTRVASTLVRHRLMLADADSGPSQKMLCCRCPMQRDIQGHMHDPRTCNEASALKRSACACTAACQGNAK